jgi:hypothetical protein
MARAPMDLTVYCEGEVRTYQSCENDDHLSRHPNPGEIQ